MEDAEPLVEPQSGPLSPGLYIVATPIGNLGDITFRAAETLRRCDAIACEDTRVTQKLIRHLGIARPLWRYDDHASEESRSKLLDAMAEKAIALVSDAGTPIISDPGYRLAREARARGIAVTSLPGPSAPIVALTLSGLPSDRFLFAGFLPAKDAAREGVLTELATVRATLVFFDTAPRLLKSLAAVDRLLPGREIAVARELTKLFEECRTGSASDLAEHFQAHPPRGELVILVAPPVDSSVGEGDIDAMLRAALETHKPSQAAADVARATGHDRKQLYARALALK